MKNLAFWPRSVGGGTRIVSWSWGMGRGNGRAGCVGNGSGLIPARSVLGETSGCRVR
jgi:hypothetical protein